MKKTLLATVLSFFALSAYSQPVQNLFKRNIDAHIDLVPLGFPDASVRFGSELMLGNRWSTGLNLGIGVPIFGNRGLGLREPRWTSKYQLLEARPEFKFYWFKRERIGWYAGTEAFISTMTAAAQDNYHFLENSTDYRLNFDYADYSKTKFGMIGKLGGRFLMGRRFTVDFFTGLGLSQTNSSYKNYLNPVVTTADPFFEGENYVVGKRLTAHFSAGLRLGMVIWQKKKNENN